MAIEATATEPSPPPTLTVEQRTALGKRARQARPRSAIGSWQPSTDRLDPISILEAQATTRVAELIPIRHGRMAASSFAFYRGAAAVMAADLGALPTTGLEVQLCGDAHVANFGGFAAPDRRMVFDLNDFDETHPGPFEWDVLRFGASVEIAARALDMPSELRADAVARGVSSYRRAIASFAAMTDLEVWYQRLDLDGLEAWVGADAGKRVQANLQSAVRKAQKKDRFKALSRLTEVVDGERTFVSDPPLLVPGRELFPGYDREHFDSMMRGLIESYVETLPARDQHLARAYRFRHVARKVVGVGSVGTRCWVVLLTGRDDQDPLFLQVKEAEASVLEPYTRVSIFENHGERVVRGQNLMQAASDVFLGWDRVLGDDGVERDFFVRQLWDWKASADLTVMEPAVVPMYAEVCGWTLARAHARTGDRVALAGYLGTSDTFDRAVAAFASTYADQNERDHAALEDAIKSGRVEAQFGI